MAKIKKKNEKNLEHFIAHTFEMSEYWADVIINDIKKPSRSRKLEPAEYKALQILLETEASREALKKLLIDCGHSNTFSTMTYIDGCTGVKPVELVSVETGEPIAEDMLHEHLSSLPWGDKWEEISNSQLKKKRRWDSNTA